jgi:hypothetical protein
VLAAATPSGLNLATANNGEVLNENILDYLQYRIGSGYVHN